MKSNIPVSRNRRGQRGSLLLESALSFSAFLLLTFGVMEFSMAVFAYNFVSYAAREGARWASVRGSTYVPAGTTVGTPATADQIRDFVRSQAVGLIANNVTVTTTWSPDNAPGSNVRVAVSYNVIPLVGLALKNNLTVSSAAQLVIVQ